MATLSLGFRRASCVVSLLAAACANPPAPRASNPPPRAEFLLSSADSTFWVATTTGETRVRGAPLVLANYDSRFYEIYSADDDYSYPDAILVGERLYRRDLLTGDSLLVFADTTVPRIAREYAAAHPDERPLGPDDDGDANPSTNVTAEVDVLDVYGPHLSFEYHVDVELPGRPAWHSTRRGVLDLHTGKEESVGDLFGRATGQRVVAGSRRAYQSARDSLRRARSTMDDDDRRAAAAMEGLQFDERSFSLTDVDGRPAVRFGVPGHGAGAAGNAVDLDPVEVDSTAWWRTVVSGLPVADDEGNDRWNAPDYHVLARYDTSGEIARVSIADSANREWPVVSVATPLLRVDWLDRPPIGAAQRKALARAFSEAAEYDRETRVASAASRGFLHLVTSHASIQVRSRKPARDVRAHDAGTCQQPGSCVRRRDTLDDGQVRGDRRVSAQPRQRRHGIDRSRRFSRADSPGRPRGDESQRQLRRAQLDGSGRACGGGRSAHRSPATHKLVLSDVRCR